MVGILLECFLVTGRNEVVAKVMFLHVSVILLTGGSPGRENPPGPGRPPPRPGRPSPPDQADPPRTRQAPPQDQADPPPRPPDQADTPPRTRHQHTVNERPVRILLECILVSFLFFLKKFFLFFFFVFFFALPCVTLYCQLCQLYIITEKLDRCHLPLPVLTPLAVRGNAVHSPRGFF